MGAQADRSLIMREGAPVVDRKRLVTRTCKGDWLGAQTVTPSSMLVRGKVSRGGLDVGASRATGANIGWS